MTKSSPFGLIGKTLSHSFSPEIHALFGLSDYSLIELSEEELIAFLQKKDFCALNVTMPYKKAVIPYLSYISPEAKAIGSVNTIVKEKDSSLSGYNTDAYGLIAAAAHGKIDFSGAKVLILGSGGAGVCARYVAASMGAKSVTVISRGGENNYSNLHLHKDADIIVNATPVGMKPYFGESLVDLSLFPKLSGVIDLVYNPQRTALIYQAERLNIKAEGGLMMLISQAKAAEELFRGIMIEDEITKSNYSIIKKKMLNIALIGMPACGKSSIAKALKEISGREMLDCDELIEEKEHRCISQIFCEDSQDYFRSLESDMLSQLGAKCSAIIATGGGCILREQNRYWLKANSRIYYIKRDVSLLERRGRPNSIGADLYQMLEIREPKYLDFCDAVIENNKSIEEAAELIWRDFNENTSD